MRQVYCPIGGRGNLCLIGGVRQSAAIVAAAVSFAAAACMPGGGPGTYGEPGHPLTAYPVDHLVESGSEADLLKRVRAALKREGLWTEVHRAQAAPGVLMFWASPRVHGRLDEMLRPR